jgi:hypothetical protein
MNSIFISLTGQLVARQNQHSQERQAADLRRNIPCIIDRQTDRQISGMDMLKN